jgi:hypothetical protein
MDAKTHWEKVYATKAPDQVSWYRPRLETSLALIDRAAGRYSAFIIDVGGGESTMQKRCTRNWAWTSDCSRVCRKSIRLRWAPRSSSSIVTAGPSETVNPALEYYVECTNFHDRVRRIAAG